MENILKALKIQSNGLWMLGQLIRWHAVITSGYYKNRNIQRPDGKDENDNILWKGCTDKEKLEMAFGSMDAHCRNLFECSENIKGIS